MGREDTGRGGIDDKPGMPYWSERKAESRTRGTDTARRTRRNGYNRSYTCVCVLTPPPLMSPYRVKQVFVGGWKPQPCFHEEGVHDHVKSGCSSLVGEPLKLVGIDGALIKEIHIALEVLRREGTS